MGGGGERREQEEARGEDGAKMAEIRHAGDFSGKGGGGLSKTEGGLLGG